METENEVKKIREILRVLIESNYKDDEILEKFSIWKTLRIKCWIRRFTSKLQENIKGKNKGTSTTVEFEKEKLHLIKIALQSYENKTWFQEQKLILNLQRNTNDMYKYRGRIQED